MKDDILVLGSDGYTGWPLVCNLLERGDSVIGVDNLSRREKASPSVTSIASPRSREAVANKTFEGKFEFIQSDITNKESLREILELFEPKTVVNLAQIPSAPYSMKGIEEAWETQENNVRGSLNLYWCLNELGMDSHVVQLATMGEYGTPDHKIPEGFLDDGCPAPKDPGSLYHASKVNTTVNTYFCSKTWDIPTTEIYQGIVYGVSMFEDVDMRLVTRFDADSIWGTVVNRFTVQSVIDKDLTVYGRGGQKRAMLSLPDCIQCLTLAIDNPPKSSYRAVNQFDESHRVVDIAEMVSDYTGVGIRHIENPREEDDSKHFYRPVREELDKLGYEPTRTVEEEFELTYDIISNYSDRIRKQKVVPNVSW